MDSVDGRPLSKIDDTGLTRLALVHLIESNISPVPESGCWLWTGAWNVGGYGARNFLGKTRGMHRASWIAFRADIPAGLIVLHKCDTRSCVNPDHLRVGTHKDNTQDAVSKGRQYRHKGENHPNSKMTEEIVREIRASPLPQRKLAKKYGITQMAVWQILARRNWKHVE